MSFHVITVGQCTHLHVHVTFLGISKQSHIQKILSVMRRLTIWAQQRLLVNTCWTEIKNKKFSVLGWWLFQDPICYCVGRGALPTGPLQKRIQVEDHLISSSLILRAILNTRYLKVVTGASLLPCLLLGVIEIWLDVYVLNIFCET